MTIWRNKPLTMKAFSLIISSINMSMKPIHLLICVRTYDTPNKLVFEVILAMWPIFYILDMNGLIRLLIMMYVFSNDEQDTENMTAPAPWSLECRPRNHRLTALTDMCALEPRLRQLQSLFNYPSQLPITDRRGRVFLGKLAFLPQ